MAMMLHQLMKLLLLLFVVNLPSCWSECDISAARRDAISGACRKVNPSARQPTLIARRAAKQANVKLNKVEEAYYNRVWSCYTIFFSVFLCFFPSSIWLIYGISTPHFLDWGPDPFFQDAGDDFAVSRGDLRAFELH